MEAIAFGATSVFFFCYFIFIAWRYFDLKKNGTSAQGIVIDAPLSVDQDSHQLVVLFVDNTGVGRIIYSKSAVFGWNKKIGTTVTVLYHERAASEGSIVVDLHTKLGGSLVLTAIFGAVAVYLAK